jgi:hypothetical protein
MCAVPCATCFGFPCRQQNRLHHDRKGSVSGACVRTHAMHRSVLVRAVPHGSMWNCVNYCVPARGDSLSCKETCWETTFKITCKDSRVAVAPVQCCCISSWCIRGCISGCIPRPMRQLPPFHHPDSSNCLGKWSSMFATSIQRSAPRQ